MISIDDVLAKVRALQELAARSTSADEAATAAATADALLQKHRLSQADVDASAGGPAEALCDDPDPLWLGKRRLSWIGRLAAILAEHYGCAVYTRTQVRTRARRRRRPRAPKQEILGVALHVAGLPSDIAIVRFMFAWLSVEVARLAVHEGRARSAFAHGAVTGIARALRESQETANAAHAVTHGTVAALVLASRSDATTAWLRAQGEIGPPRSPRAPKDLSAYARGIAAGERIDLGRQALPSPVRALPGRAGG